MRRMLLGLFCAMWICSARAEPLNVGVAISMKEGMLEIEKAYADQGGSPIEFAFGSSGQIANQIKNGAPIDVFISAADKQVDDLIKAGAVDADTRQVVAGNSIVLIVSKQAKDAPKTFKDLADPRFTKIAIGEPKTVPAGQYAMQVLTAEKIADVLDERLVYGSNVRQVLDYIVRGEVSAAIVYATDARQAGDQVKVIATADAKSHDAVRYPAILVKASKAKDAGRKFLEFLAGDKAQAILKSRGFASPEKTSGK
jgi:molybdate transport system substrate-binding protein